MSDLRLNLEGDLDIQEGKLSLLQSTGELTTQSLSITLRTYQGEWFLNTTVGVPYTQTILRKGTPKTLVDSIFYKNISNYTGVENIASFESTIDSGVYSLSFTARIGSGELINLTQDITIT